MQTIETERLILRPWKESDAEALFKYASDGVHCSFGGLLSGKSGIRQSDGKVRVC